MVMKKWWLCVVAVCCLAGCANEIPEEDGVTMSGRTIVAYLVANNRMGIDLSADLKQNVVWMYQSMAAMKDSCRLLVYYRPNAGDAEMSTPSLLEFVADGQGHINTKAVDAGGRATFGEVVNAARVIRLYDGSQNATSPDAMRQVFSDVREAAPSDSYGLICGSHATGWLPAPRSLGRSFGDDAGYSIDIPVLASTLRNCFPEKLDFILFDACMMGCAEVAYEMKDATRYCIASVVETPTTGFPYHRMLSYLYEKEIPLQEVCTTFTSFVKENVPMWASTCAAFDSRAMDALASTVRGELVKHKSSFDESLNESVQQYGVKGKGFKYFSFDLKDLVQTLNADTLPTAFAERLDAAVPALSCESGRLPGSSDTVTSDKYGGMGIYIPYTAGKNSWDNYCQTSIAWYKAVGWDEVLGF